MELIFHMAREAEWATAECAGTYQGADEDQADGFIHFSTATQVRESAAKHRTGEAGLILVACRTRDRLLVESHRGRQSCGRDRSASPPTNRPDVR